MYQLVRSLGLKLDPGSSTPIYRQIYEQIVERISSGALPVGFRLPPTRTLAKNLSAHRNTVVRAFAELAQDGWVDSVVGRGTFVAKRPERGRPAEPPRTSELPWSALRSRAASAEPLGRLDRLRRDAAPPSDAVNLTRMQPSHDLLSTDLLRRCLDHVMRTLGPRALGYAPREGLPRLREQIVADLARRNVPARVEDVLVTTGSQQALDLIARTLVDPGDRFLVEGKTYSGALNVLAAAGAQIVGVPSDDEGPDIGALRRLAQTGGVPVKGLYLMPNCRNPTGTAVTAARREALVHWSHEAGVPIVEDDYGADLSLDMEPEPLSMRALDGEILYVGTFSKKLIPALRVGYIVCPPGLSGALAALKHAMDLGTSCLLQHALAEFLERGYLARHLDRVLPVYAARRDALVEAMTRHLPRSVVWERPRHGVVSWLELPGHLDPEAVFAEARRRGVIVTPGTLYSVSERDRGGLRLTFCAEPEDRLALGVRRLGEAIRAVDRLSRERHSAARAYEAPVVEGV